MPFAARDAVKDAVREAADIVEVIGEHVALRRSGARYMGLCPFHGEKTPSFSVNPQEQLFYCFGCGARGDVFSFVMQHEHVDFPEALKMLAARYHITLPDRQLSDAERARLKERDRLYAVYEAATRCYEKALWDAGLGAPGRGYLEARGVPAEAARQYRLGYASTPEIAGWDWLTQMLSGTEGPHFDRELLVQAGLAAVNKSGRLYDRFRGRVLFPLIDTGGRVTAFGGRLLGEGQPKYMNSPESPIFSKSRQLFGLYPHREAIRKARRALVVEGNFDLLSLAIHGVGNVVAPLGTALTRDHVHALAHYCDEVVLLFDADIAGSRAAMRSIPFFLEEGLAARVALLPQGHDPDSYVREQGRAAIDALVESALPLAEFFLDALIARHGLSLGGKAQIVQELKPLIRSARKQEQRELMVAHFAGRLGLSTDYFRGGAVPPGPEAPPSPEETCETAAPEQPLICPLRWLSRQENQVLDFLLFWPEYCQPLADAGLAGVLRSPALARLLELMLAHGAATASAPEYLLAAPLEADERAYIAERLGQPPAFVGGDAAAGARTMFGQLMQWIRQQQRLQESARLQRALEAAERWGDSRGALELLRARRQSDRGAP